MFEHVREIAGVEGVAVVQRAASIVTSPARQPWRATSGQVANQFAEKEAKFWNSSMTIVSFDKIERTAWRPYGLDYIPRRYCSAVATTSDGVRRKVDYSVRESLGIIGAKWGIEFCVHGLDRNLAYAYATACRMARP